ncbi:hypothetical protein Hypma_013558 [Hypsizygus marmoreus]|uniref:Fungal-type protein kinase domain-containing protein n=1 Tax=Hypsizygus marmoreus TaxID=39966 RepID=A0A369JAV6_HYPMA|nr:hypothetical protein Hypma_013558 [Hypsizygus marmoreus]
MSSSTSSSSSYSDDSDSFESYYSDMSTTSTPNKRRSAGVANQTLENVTPHMQDDVQGMLCPDAPIEAFVQHVWGVHPDEISAIFGNSWTLPPEHLDKYRATVLEKKLYEPFQLIAVDLVNQARKLLRKDASCPVKFWHKEGEYVIKSKVSTLRKPDMLSFLTLATLIKISWFFARTFFEFKDTDHKHRKRVHKPTVSSTSALPLVPEGVPSEDPGPSMTTSDSHQVVHRSSLVKSMRGKSRRGSHSTTRLRRDSTPATSAEGVFATPLPSITTPPQPITPQKRKNEGSDSSANKRIHLTPKVTKEQIQLALYALESMDASTRHYTTGFFIDRYKVSLWYFDRACIIRSEPFDFTQDPWKLVLALYALSVCDDKHAGYDPHLFPPPSGIPTEASSGDSIAEDVVGSKLIFPPMDGLSDSIEFLVRRIIFEYRGLIGRGTMVYEVLRLGRTEAEALKISWPLTIRDLEATIIRTLRERIPGWKDHLPEVSFSTTLTAEELGLPRVQLLKQVPPTDFRLEDRHMHAMAGELYKKLWEVDSVAEFEQVFLDCVECHYHAFNEGKVLHRDLSENNLMFKRKEGEVKGILNDWDMASFLDVTNKVRNTTAKHRTGTIPFMACDLLVDDPPAHLYRHDLESFFYILVWAAILYDFKNKAILRVPKPLANWDAGEMSRVRQAKGSFITYKLETDLIMNLIQPAFHGIRDKWILPLRMLFKNALRSIDDEADQNPSYDIETCGGHITFLTFMKALNREPRTLA